MAITISIDERIKQNPEEHRLVENAIQKLNLNEMNLPTELQVKWQVDDEPRSMSAGRHYEVILTETGWNYSPFFGVSKKQLEKDEGIDEIKREFNWCLGDYLGNHVKSLLKELENTESTSRATP